VYFVRSKRRLRSILLFNIYFNFQVKRAIQQTGFRRSKRGFKPKIRGVPVSEIRLKDPEAAQLLDYSKSYNYAEPQDPLFKKEWYLVSTYFIFLLMCNTISTFKQLTILK